MTSTYSKVFSQSSSIHSTICREQITSTSQKLLVVLLEKCPDRWNPETHHVRTHRKISYRHLPKVLVLFFFFFLEFAGGFASNHGASNPCRPGQRRRRLGPGPGMVLKAWGWGLGLRWELRWGGRWMREERGIHMKCGPKARCSPPETICSWAVGRVLTADIAISIQPVFGPFLLFLFLSPVSIYPTICFVFPLNNAERQRMRYSICDSASCCWFG